MILEKGYKLSKNNFLENIKGRHSLLAFIRYQLTNSDHDFFARHHIFFNMLKRDPFGFRDERKSYHDEDQVESCVDPECPMLLRRERKVAPMFMFATQLVVVEQVIPKSRHSVIKVFLE